MRICYIAGASSIHTIRWVNAMADLGHDVALLTIHSFEFKEFDNRVKVYELRVKNKLGYYLNLFEAKRFIKKFKPDIVHVHYASGYGTLGRLLNFKPTLLSVWGSDVYLFPYQSKRNERILRKNLCSADKIASTSHAMRKQTEKFINPLTSIEITPFGIDLELFKPRKSIENKNITIGTVRSLKSVYGIDILIQSTASLLKYLNETNQKDISNRIRLKIVGDGPEKSNLELLARELQIEHITEFVGKVSNSEVPNYLNQFDIYCALSRSESFGVSVLEASACEVPVVVSNIGGLPEVVADGITGFLVNNTDIDEIVNKLQALVLNKVKRIKMGEQGRKYVEEHYDWNKSVKKMINIYRDLI